MPELDKKCKVITEDEETKLLSAPDIIIQKEKDECLFNKVSESLRDRGNPKGFSVGEHLQEIYEFKGEYYTVNDSSILKMKITPKEKLKLDSFRGYFKLRSS